MSCFGNLVCLRYRFAICVIMALAPAAGVASAGDSRHPMRIEVDASEITREIVHVQMLMTAEPGPMTLVYPVWIPGHHGSEDLVRNVAGLSISAGDGAIDWRRDSFEMNKIHLVVPGGAEGLQLQYDVIVDAGRVSPRLAFMDWPLLTWYPDGIPAREIVVQIELQIPEAWRLGTALSVAESNGASYRFDDVTLDTLADSPFLIGAHLEEIPIGAEAKIPHWLVLAADREEAMQLNEAQRDGYNRLVEEAHELFGSLPYRSYRFLYALSDHIDFGGLEHHESSMNRSPERTLLDEAIFKPWSDMLPHEFVHAWNGKYRRPSGLFRTDFHQAKNTELLWIYEGLTQYLGMVLTARSGLISIEDMREYLAAAAQVMASHSGRSWRPLRDTAVASRWHGQLSNEWRFRRRGTRDYYFEGALLWLEVDGIIREKTGGERSLDDFCRTFFGGHHGSPAVAPYSLSDVLDELQAIAQFDWEVFFDLRVNQVRGDAPIDGLERCGWRLTSQTTRSTGVRILDDWYSGEFYDASIGLLIGGDGAIVDVVPTSPADLAGVAPGSQLRAVNGRKYSPTLLREAIAATTDGHRVRLLVEKEEFFTEYELDYDGGERYPGLERIQDRPDLLSQILSPIVSGEE